MRESLHLAASRFHSAAAEKRIVEFILEDTRLADVAARTVGKLAHGQRQWVELGMVLAREPLQVLLDEPTAGMTAEETSEPRRLSCA